MGMNINVQGGSSVKLLTAGKYCEENIIVTATGDGGSSSLIEVENLSDIEVFDAEKIYKVKGEVPRGFYFYDNQFNKTLTLAQYIFLSLEIMPQVVESLVLVDGEQLKDSDLTTFTALYTYYNPVDNKNYISMSGQLVPMETIMAQMGATIKDLGKFENFEDLIETGEDTMGTYYYDNSLIASSETKILAFDENGIKPYTDFRKDFIEGTLEELTEEDFGSSSTVRNRCFYRFSDLKRVKTSNLIVAIYEGAFERCRNLTSFTFGKNVRDLSSNIFYDCSALEEVKFLGKPDSINSQAFFGTGNANYIIYVPWSEGEVENAPWGGNPNSIVYNTKFDENGNII